MSGPEPTYRIFIVPGPLDRTAVCTRSEAVKSLLMSPPGLRPGGFGFRGLGRTQLTPEGTVAPGFVPAQTCRQLVEEVYAHFGYGSEEIPLLEELEEAAHEMSSA